MTVTPTIRWNRARRTFYDIRASEDWTLNGPLLDNLTFVGGLESGKAIVASAAAPTARCPSSAST